MLPENQHNRKLRLSIIDGGWPGHLKVLVRESERLGYHRFWTTEHHAPGQSASPLVAAVMAAALTRRIRVGTAGILLNYQAPLKVAEDAFLSELLFPNRFDLGFAGGMPLNGALSSGLLDGRESPSRSSYATRLGEVVSILSGRENPVEASPIHRLSFGMASAPKVWICGTTPESAALAAKLGTCYSFHHHLALSRPNVDGRGAVRRYVEMFRPSAFASAPEFNIAAYGLCAEQEDVARAVWGHQVSSFMGNPSQCQEQIEALASHYASDEVVLQCFAADNRSRLRSYRLLSEVFELECEPVRGKLICVRDDPAPSTVQKTEDGSYELRIGGSIFELNEQSAAIVRWLFMNTGTSVSDLIHQFRHSAGATTIRRLVRTLVKEQLCDLL
ncbi:MAG: hypothetical protein JWN34_800 [Bryobacterales bacterium]|nr:hypothetical protein [Bryobacterales bacterium]